jgi:hypothetical protein
MIDNMSKPVDVSSNGDIEMASNILPLSKSKITVALHSV